MAPIAGCLRLAVLEEHHERDRRDAVALREILLLVDVDLDELDLVLVGDPVEHRGDGVARATPLGPEVDDHLAVGLQDLGLERVCCCVRLPIRSFLELPYTGVNAAAGSVCSRKLRSKHVRAASGQTRPSRARARDPRALGARADLRAAPRAQPRRPAVVVRRRAGDREQTSLAVHTAWGRTLKDVFQRYKALRGFDQRYQNGFDCQGLWIEVGVERAARPELEARDRGVRARGVRARAAARSSSGSSASPDPRVDPARPVDGLGQRLLHLQRHEHRVHLEVPEDRPRARLALHGAPLDRVVPALRHVALAARADAVGRLPGSRRPVALRPLPAARPRRASHSSSGRRRRGRCRRTSRRPCIRTSEYGRRENGEWVAVEALPRRHATSRRCLAGARRLALPRPVRRPPPGRIASSTA